MSNQPYPPDPNQPNQQPTYRDNQVPADPANNAARSANSGNAYAQSQYQSYVDPAGNQVESRQEIFEDKNQSRANARYWVTTITYFILGVLEVILLLRLIFRLLGANQDNGFISFLYNLSYVFVAPFNGIFNTPPLGRGAVFELSTVIAMLVYALIAWGIVSLGRVVFSSTLPSRQSNVTTRRSRNP